jgi:hypothetical protein
VLLTINRYYLTVLYQSVCIIMQNVNYEAENNSLNIMVQFSDLKFFTCKLRFHCLEFASYIIFETVHKKAKHYISESLTPL